MAKFNIDSFMGELTDEVMDKFVEDYIVPALERSSQRNIINIDINPPSGFISKEAIDKVLD